MDMSLALLLFGQQTSVVNSVSNQSKENAEKSIPLESKILGYVSFRFRNATKRLTI